VRYEENGEGGFASDLSTSVFDFFSSFFVFLITFFASFFLCLDLLPFPAIASSRAARNDINLAGCSSTDEGSGKRLSGIAAEQIWCVKGGG
jgi:hypothetical protein